MSRNTIAINNMRQKIAAVSETLQLKMREKIRDELGMLAAKQFAQGIDPDGNPWALTLDGRKPLQALGSTVTVTVEGENVVVRISHRNARFLQAGWATKSGKHTKGRFMMPGKRRVGRLWLKAIRKGAQAALDAARNV